jgi:hypothetical protein
MTIMDVTINKRRCSFSEIYVSKHCSAVMFRVKAVEKGLLVPDD